MKKRILSLVLALCTVLAFMPTVQFTKAAETTVVASGTCGATESDNVTWKLSSDGTMTISGCGK